MSINLPSCRATPARPGNSSDGVIARSQIAEVLVSGLTSDEALQKTFEIVASKGPAQDDLDALFAALDSDSNDNLDGVRDTPNQPLEEEPKRVRAIWTLCRRTAVVGAGRRKKGIGNEEVQIAILDRGSDRICSTSPGSERKLANIALGMSEADVKTACDQVGSERRHVPRRTKSLGGF